MDPIAPPLLDPLTPPPPINTTTAAAAQDSPSCPSPSASSQKIRLMCSYGGHIVPRPMDKTLFYAGGETRIVAIDRRSAYSLSTLNAHLSKTLMNGRPFSLKYQLPNHDLDSLISISTKEDLANMIDEYDRLAASATPSRLRFFLFPLADLHDPTSEDWFIDALRNVGVVSNTKARSSDSADNHPPETDAKSPLAGVSAFASTAVDSPISLADSMPLEKSSSFGSTGSSASASNSPAIRGGGDEGVGVRLPDFKIAVPVLDSVGSESSTPSPNYSPHGMVFQDASGFIEPKVVSANLVETDQNSTPDRSPRGDLLTPVQVPGYILTKPLDQQQQMPPSPTQTSYIHPHSPSHYITQYYTGSLPVASYTSMYQTFAQPQQTVQYQVNKPQTVYMMQPVGQAQSPFDRPMQSPLSGGPSVGSSHSQVSSNPVMVAAPMTYEAYKPHTPAPDYGAKVYITPAVATQPVSVPSDEHHHQVVAFPSTSQPAQAVATAATIESAGYVGEYEDAMHAQIYKTQPPAPVLPSQLQIPTSAATVVLTETLTQLHVDTTKH